MGESSAPRRPTHDTNTSRRQVKTHKHTHTYQQQQQQQHFIKYKHIMKIAGLIASTLMLLVLVMPTSPASARLLAFPDDLPTGFGSIEHEYVDRRRLAAMAQEDVPKVEEDVPKVEVEQETVSTGESTNAPMMKKETNTTEKKENNTSTGTDAVDAVDALPQLLSLNQYNVE